MTTDVFVPAPLYIVLLGPPGAGKGTQAATLAAQFDLAHVSSGDLFRENLQQGTELGKLAKSYMDKGELVPDQVTISMVMQRLERIGRRGVILDGFPRTLAQAKALDEALAGQGQRLDLALLIQVGDDELVSRLTGRRVCRQCGAVYHLVFNPPKTQGTCDACGAAGTLYQRDDDLLDTVRRRLYTYYKETGPLIGYYFAKNLLVQIDGERDIGDVQADLKRTIFVRRP